MTRRISLFAVALALALLGSCAAPPPPQPVIVVQNIPPGSRVEYYAQIYDDSWQPTMTMNSLPHSMHVRVAEKWALSAAQQRLGSHWKDYCFRVILPEGGPAVVWQRRGVNHL